MKRTPIIALLIALSVILFVNLPLVWALVAPRSDLFFLGRRQINSQDMYTYVASIEQARQGKLLFENLLTNEPQTRTLVRPLYAVIGIGARVANISSVSAYQLARVIVSLIFCLVLYLFLCEIFSSQSLRLFAFTLLLTGSGLGWIVGRWIESSSDLWIPESNVFMSLAESPHFIFSQTLMLLIFFLFLRYLTTQKKVFAVGVVLGAVLLAFEHPFDLLIVGPVLLSTGLLTGVAVIPLLIVVFLTMIGIIYPLIELRLNPIFASEQAQGVSYSPSPMSYLSGFGLVIPPAIAGANTALTKTRPVIRMMLLWASIGILSLYAPVSFQRRLSEGLWIPIAILASLGWEQCLVRLGKRSRLVRLGLSALVLGVLAISSVRLVISDLQIIRSESTQSYYYSILPDEVAAFSWIKAHASTQDVILSNWFYGNLIPGFTGKRVFIGHKAQTIDFDRKVTEINSFLLEKDPSVAQAFLEKNRIKYIFVAKADSLTQYGFKPDERAYLKKVFDQNGARVYEATQ